MKVCDWGRIEYESAQQRQLELVDQIAAGSQNEHLIFCSHPSVVTLGRASRPEDVMDWQGAIAESTRGGRATYHGPQQLVIYPILDLKRTGRPWPVRDIHAYLRGLENLLCEALKALGVQNPSPRPSTIRESESLHFTGVWVGDRKLASIGIAVRKWITYHGAAINLAEDPKAFTGIRPCGFQREVMTNLEAELGQPVDKLVLQKEIERRFTSYQL